VSSKKFQNTSTLLLIAWSSISQPPQNSGHVFSKLSDKLFRQIPVAGVKRFMNQGVHQLDTSLQPAVDSDLGPDGIGVVALTVACLHSDAPKLKSPALDRDSLDWKHH